MHALPRRLFSGIFLATGLWAQPPQLAEPEPGQVFLTPQVDLGLVPVPLVVPEKFRGLVPEGRTLNLPPGFSARVFAAAGLEGPRMMALSPEGVLHVANMKAGSASQFRPPVDTDQPPPLESRRGQIVALPDGDGDGVADTALVVADNLWWANSLAFHGDALYVADTHEVLRFTDPDGDGVYKERAVLVPDIPTRGQHITRTLAIDGERGKLYVSVGSTCDLCREEDPERATILEFGLDGSGRRIFARGLRNAVGLAIHPRTGQLWATNNGHDREGRHLPPELITAVSDGGFYGWPLAYGYRVWVDFSISAYERALFPLSARDSADVASMERPRVQVPAHLAPMDILFYKDGRFPAEYGNAAFVALRGGSNAAGIGHKVVALFMEADGSVARVADFLTGFHASARGTWGRPVGLAVDGRGDLYMSSDWDNHLVVKIVPRALRGLWEQTPPEVLLAGGRLLLNSRLKVEGLDPEGRQPVVVADLSEVGGPGAQPLEALGGGIFRLRAELQPAGTGMRHLRVRIAQQVPGDRLEALLLHPLSIVPGEDLVIAGEGMAAGWRVEGDKTLQVPGFSTEGPVFQGASLLLRAEGVTFSGWNLRFEAEVPSDTLGYRALAFAFHPGDAGGTERPRLVLFVRPGRSVDLVAGGHVDLSQAVWQEVEIPLEALELEGPIENLRLQGNLEGSFYVDELRLVARTRRAPDTAVVEAREEAQAEGFALEANFPNPFNSATQIRFSLARGGAVRLGVFNLVGQEVAVLVRGERGAGRYAVSWDGRDGEGRVLGSGVYFYRLESGEGVETRKLLLLR